MKKGNILICDDEKILRDSYELILDDNYRLSFAANGEEAIEHIKNKEASLIILDIKMPRMNGLEALKQIKKLKPDIKVLVVTGYESVDIAQESIKYGAANYIIKPFGKNDILKAVEALLGNK